MFKDIDTQMKQFTKGMEQNNKTLATILAKVLNPNVMIPESFGVAPSTLSHDDLIQSSPLVVSGSTVSPSTPARVISPATPRNVSGETVLAANSCLSSTSGSSDISSPMSTENSIPPRSDSIVTQESCSLNVSQPNRIVTSDTVMVDNSSCSSTPSSSYTSHPMFARNLTPPYEETIQVAQQSSLNVVHPGNNNDDVAVIDNSSLLTTPTGRNTSTHVAVNFVEVTQERSLLPHRNLNSHFLAGNLISELHKQSCSRRNFSTRLVRKLFDENTRRHSNVNGKRGKSKLNPVIMDYVKSLTFQYYPLEAHESEQQEWAGCTVAIDSSCRGLNKRPASLP